MRFQNLGETGTAGEQDLVVVGGGIGGMATALALARGGRTVTLLEQDDIPATDDPEAAFTSPRRGVPQARQTHGFLARLTQVLRARFPDVLDDLFAAGAREVAMVPAGDPEPGDEEIAVLFVRRTTMEWVLRRAVRRQEGVRWLGRCPVDELLVEPGSEPPRVCGVRLLDGREVPADAVVACTGRRGDVPRWYTDLGIGLPETVHRADLIYLTRWYRLAGGPPVDVDGDWTGDLGYLKYLAVPGDGDTLSVTLAVPTGDHELRRHLMRPPAFDRAAASLAGLGPVFADHDPTPLGSVEPMTGFVNRLRRFLDAGAPTLLGFHAVGDAHTCTNPFYGRGCSLAAAQAGFLADAFAAHDDPAERAVAYERDCAREIEPWFHHAVLMDTLFDPAGRRERRALARPGAEDPEPAVRAIMAAGATDPVIGRALQRVFNLLTLPEDLVHDSRFTARVGEIMADPSSVPPIPRRGPRREELLSAPGGGQEDA